VLAFVILLGLAVLFNSLTKPDGPAVQPQDALASSAASTAMSVPEREPTPVIATCEGTDVHLPIDTAQVTVVAFHQASYPDALHLAATVPDADADALAAAIANGTVVEDAWDGTCIRLWRTNRTGPPDTAIDVGAAAGTPVYAPVTGTVVDVKAYLLYQKYNDFEIHIRPDGCNTAAVVLIHVAGPTVAVGDHVVGGVTSVAVVRRLADKFTLQLGAYTTNGGDHVHVQMNCVETSGTVDIGGS